MLRDENGQLTEIAYPGSDNLQFTEYDYAGNLLTRVDGNSATTHYVYDNSGGALSAITYPTVGGSANPQNVSLSYDPFGRLTTVANSAASLSTSYDDLGLTLSDSTTYSGISAKTISYTYYTDLSRHTMTLPGSNTFTYGYDALGRMNSLTSPLSSTAATWTYYSNGAVNRRTLPNGAYSD